MAIYTAPYIRYRSRRTIKVLYKALCVLHAANAEGTCPLCPSAKAWESEELEAIRRAIEKEISGV